MLDYNCFVGSWPFRKIRHGTFSDLRRLHAENGIEGGFVSSSDAIFYNDPYEGDMDLARELSGFDNYKLVMTVNPLLSGAVSSIRKGKKELSAVGVRVYPGFHGFSLLSDEMRAVTEEIKKNGMTLYITYRVDDERMVYMFKPERVNPEEVEQFIRENPDLDIMLCCPRTGEVCRMKDVILQSERVFFDISGMKDGLFPKEYLVDDGIIDRLRYGSMAPMFCMKSTVLLFNEELEPRN